MLRICSWLERVLRSSAGGHQRGELTNSLLSLLIDSSIRAGEMPNRGGRRGEQRLSREAKEGMPTAGAGGRWEGWGWLGTGPWSGRRAASPSLNTWAMLKAVRGPASVSAQAANTARPAACGTGARTKRWQLQLTPTPCPEHRPRVVGGWWAAPACWSVAEFGTKGHVQAGT